MNNCVDDVLLKFPRDVPEFFDRFVEIVETTCQLTSPHVSFQSAVEAEWSLNKATPVFAMQKKQESHMSGGQCWTMLAEKQLEYHDHYTNFFQNHPQYSANGNNSPNHDIVEEIFSLFSG